MPVTRAETHAREESPRLLLRSGAAHAVRPADQSRDRGLSVPPDETSCYAGTPSVNTDPTSDAIFWSSADEPSAADVADGTKTQVGTPCPANHVCVKYRVLDNISELLRGDGDEARVQNDVFTYQLSEAGVTKFLAVRVSAWSAPWPWKASKGRSMARP